MRIVFIEAIGKKKAIELAAHEIWGRDTFVVPTGGYIYTLPNDQIGIDPITLRPKTEKLTSNGQIFLQRLNELFSKYGKTQWDPFILLTDPDREGEGIASQVSQIIRNAIPSATFERRYAHQLDCEGIKHALIEKNVHAGMVEAFTARRVVDRLLPMSAAHLLGRGLNYMGLGRLQTQAIRVVKDKSKDWQRYVLEGPWKTVEGTFFIREYSSSRSNLEAKLTRLKEFGSYAESMHHEQLLSIPAPPPHSAISLMQSLVDVRPSQVMEALQQSYESGRLSYPRTDQSALHAYAMQLTHFQAQQLHLNAKIKPLENLNVQSLSTRDLIKGAHPGLHPTMQWKPSFKIDTLIDRVESEVVARAIASILEPAVIKRKSVTLSDREGYFFEAVQDTIIEHGWTSVFNRLGLQNPLEPVSPLHRKYPTIMDQFPRPSHIVEWAAQEKLGRPSTLAELPDKLQSMELCSPACIPTLKAEQQLQSLEEVMKPYTHAAFTQLMENSLGFLLQNPGSYTDVVKSLLVQAGTDIVGLPTLLNQQVPNLHVQDADEFDSMAF